MSKKAVLLLSGGLDSTTTLQFIKKEGYEVYAISFDYGQNHSCELDAAKKVAEKYGVTKHKIIQIDLKTFGGSALTDSSILVPQSSDATVYDPKKENIPTTYVPARNTIFLSYAVGYAEVIKAEKIFIGANEIDYSGYPDCRPAYFEKFNELIELATAAGVKNELKIKIETPLLHLSKAEIIKLGIELGIDYAETISCYSAKNGISCGKCDACILRLNGFEANGLCDPAAYSK